jgi:hypothetical protein
MPALKSRRSGRKTKAQTTGRIVTLKGGRPKKSVLFHGFSHVDEFYPQKTRVSEVIDALGEPEDSEITKVKYVSGIRVGGNKILWYPTKGLMFIIVESDLVRDNPLIDSIHITALYRGKSPNGLYIGMPKSTALKICNREYQLSLKLATSYLFALKGNSKSIFQLWFDGDVVTEMSIARPIRSKR